MMLAIIAALELYRFKEPSERTSNNHYSITKTFQAELNRSYELLFSFLSVRVSIL